MSRYRMYNSLARRQERLATFTTQRRFWAKAHAWFTKNQIPWWFAPLCCALISGCSTTLLGDAESDCQRFVNSRLTAFARCNLPPRTKGNFCSDVVYSDNSEEEVDACITWNSTADCQLIDAGLTCDLHWTKNPIR